MFKNKKALFAGLPALIGILPMPGDALFSAPLVQTGNTIIAAMRTEFVRAGIPIVLIIMLMPFISGLATGLSFAFVGASFPKVFALIGNNAAAGTIAAVTTLAYSSGYLEMMFSPLHVCFVVTCEYYSTRMTRIYRYIAGPSVVILITALFMAVLYSKLL